MIVQNKKAGPSYTVVIEDDRISLKTASPYTHGIWPDHVVLEYNAALIIAMSLTSFFGNCQLISLIFGLELLISKL